MKSTLHKLKNLIIKKMSKKSIFILLFLSITCTKTNAQVTIYNDCNFSGSTKTVSVGKYNLSGSFNWDRKISSIAIPSGWAITLYENTGYNGSFYNYINSQNCLTTTNWNDRALSMIVVKAVKFYTDCGFQGKMEPYGTGSFDVDNVTEKLGNDAISSIYVPSKVKVTIFEDAGFTGNSRVLLPGSYNCLNDIGWNDKVSSFRIGFTGDTNIDEQ